ncbi:hypothetical protein G7046_g4388 [Stylonectria norvegica]|nr:hypothetical protein G7046_g4388 [Stylonectria norvegica]
MSDQAPRPRRMLRVSNACDYCHKRRIKCRSSFSDATQCQNCVDFGLACQHSRPMKRGRSAANNADEGSQRGTSIRTAGDLVWRNSSQAQATECTSSATAAQKSGPGALDPTSGFFDEGNRLSPAWTAFARSSAPLVRELLNVYFETVYPIFPLFDRTNLERRIADEEQTRDRGFFCSVMAACALAFARVRDGAIVSLDRHSPDFRLTTPEIFLVAAEESLPDELLETNSFDVLRAFALLSLVGIQDGRIDAMKKYLGHYFTMMAIRQWHDESNWPQDLDPIAVEERRRLYWSIYTLDIYTAIIWDGCFHFQEGHARVEYPSGVVNLQAAGSPDSPNAVSWIVGWNFTTDLYRILEHTISRLRTRNSKFNLFSTALDAEFAGGGRDILQKVNASYAALPPSFKELRPATGNLGTDIYGFQAANIQATLALLRMFFFSLESGVDVEKKCSVVSDVLATFHRVPTEFQRAISTPLIYHIAGIGNILGSVMEGPLTERSYRHVRELLISMAALLETLEAFLHRRTGAGRRLREQVERIDKYMASRREAASLQAQMIPMGSNHVSPTGQGEGVPDVIEELSPQFQIPDELLLNWDWPMDVYQSTLEFFDQNGRDLV